MVVGGGGIVCCEKKRIWGCSCIVAFEVLNGAPGDARGGTGRGLELDTPRVIWAMTPGEAGAIGTHAGSDRRRGAPLSSGHRTPPGATLRCPAKGHAVDLERVGKGRRAPMSTPSGILNRISASLIVSSRSITLVY